MAALVRQTGDARMTGAACEPSHWRWNALIPDRKKSSTDSFVTRGANARLGAGPFAGALRQSLAGFCT